MSAADAPAQSGRLPDHCSELFAFALSLRTAQDPGDAGALFETVGRLVERMSRNARDAGVDSSQLDAARYALCALIDETVLGSRWAIRTQWMQKPLQMAYFGDFTAGEQFYRRLDDLRRDPRHNADVIEVYAMCLAAGFRGKYADLAGMQKIDDLVAEIDGELRGVRGTVPRTLSPTVTRTATIASSARPVPVWVVAAAGAALLLLLLFAFDALLGSQAAAFLEPGGSGQ